MRDLFEQVYVINLARRTDRWDAFCERLPDDWPFKPPQRWEGIDGKNVFPPEWWKGGNGAWGCYRSHLQILEYCLNHDIHSVLIMEDDAICLDQFEYKTQCFFEAVPNDWGMIYLGGQHLRENLRLPRKINDWVYQPFNVNRCHCYGFRGRQMMQKVYQHLNNFQKWTALHHVDHCLGELHQQADKGIYTPREWLVAQMEGKSDICGKNLGLRVFPGAEYTINPPLDRGGVAILGGYFSGTNMLAGAMYRMGLSLGKDYKCDNDRNVINYFEDPELGRICRTCFEEPLMNEKLERQDRINHLRRWGGIQCQSKNPGQPYFYGKHPILSLLGTELLDAWNHPAFICVDRPDMHAIRSMNSVPWNWGPKVTGYTLQLLREAREKFFEEKRPNLLKLSFEQVKDCPETAIDSVCDFLNIQATAEQRKRAGDFIKSHDDDLCFGSNDDCLESF